MPQLPEPTFDLTPELIAQAAESIAPRLAPARVLQSDALTERLGRPVWLKLETEQPTGAFKVRGALARLAALQGDARPKGVVAASAGNHGLGVAWASRQLGIPALVVVPETVPRVKLTALEQMLVKIRRLGSSYDEAEVQARQIAEEADATFVSPFDDPWVMAGNGGTIGLELREQIPGLEIVVTPLGGGGCAAGLGAALSGQARVVGVNSEASPAMARSLAEGVVLHTFQPAPTIAEGLEGGVSDNSAALCARHVARVEVVSEAALAEAIRFVVHEHGMIIEGSAAAGVAALLEGQAGGEADGTGPLCVLLTGRNIDRDRLRAIVGGKKASGAPDGGTGGMASRPPTRLA